MIPKKIRVNWEGPQQENHSLAISNRKICSELAKEKEIELHLITDNTPAKNAPDFTIRQKWPPDFSQPESGKLIFLQPWEFSSMPIEWFEPFSVLADDIWAVSEFNRLSYINSGIPEEKVFRLPMGVKREDRKKEKENNLLKNQAGFRFLFIGGTIFRKGIDLLIQAYIEEFKKAEDICLIIKDIGLRNVYLDTYQEEILAIIAKKENAKIEYLNQELKEEEIDRLYENCHCYVHPYRGEGFGMPIVEAMAAGKPVIVPNFGPAIEYCNKEIGYLVETKLKVTDEKNFGLLNTIDFVEYQEVVLSDLRKKMRHVFENREEAKIKGLKGKKFIEREYCWENTARLVIERLKKIKNNYVVRENKEFYFNLYNNRADEFLKQENEVQAEKYLRQALFFTDNQKIIIKKLVKIALKKENYQKALKIILETIKYTAKDQEIIEILKNILKKLGDENTAKAIEKKYLD